MIQKIKFISQHIECLSGKIKNPKPSSYYLPEWYKKGNKYQRVDGKPASIIEVKNNEASPTWKNCVPFFESFSAGYMFETPCDIFVKKEKDLILLEINEDEYKSFAVSRGPSNGFHHSEEYYESHFQWIPPWSVNLPHGYSAIYVNPLNRFDLPFYTFSGIIDNDKMSTTGQYPFLIKNNFEGIIKAGTPFVQIIPFKRDNWESESVIYDEGQLILSLSKPYKYRKNKVNYYRDHEWDKKQFR